MRKGSSWRNARGSTSSEVGDWCGAKLRGHWHVVLAMPSLAEPSLTHEALRDACRVSAPAHEVSHTIRTTSFQLGLCRRGHGSASYMAYRAQVRYAPEFATWFPLEHGPRSAPTSAARGAVRAAEGRAHARGRDANRRGARRRARGSRDRGERCADNATGSSARARWHRPRSDWPARRPLGVSALTSSR